MTTAAERLSTKIEKILKKCVDTESADQEINDGLDMQEILTTALLPMNSKLRNRIMGAFIRDTERKRRLALEKEIKKEEEMVAVEVPGGGKCKITVWMTKEQAERERKSR